MESVIKPIGKETVKKATTAPRPSTLNGKTVVEIWNEDFKGNIMFPMYRELLKKRYPGVKIVPYTDVPVAALKGTPAYQREVLANIVAAVKAHGADAVITGNGG
jgi:hypothetical protein